MRCPCCEQEIPKEKEPNRITEDGWIINDFEEKEKDEVRSVKKNETPDPQENYGLVAIAVTNASASVSTALRKSTNGCNSASEAPFAKALSIAA